MTTNKNLEIQKCYNVITQLKTITDFDVTDLINKMHKLIEELKEGV